MKNFAKALYQHAVIVHHIAHEYEDSTTVTDIREDHPELDFMDTEEIQEILIQAKHWRKKSSNEQNRLLLAMESI